MFQFLGFKKDKSEHSDSAPRADGNEYTHAHRNKTEGNKADGNRVNGSRANGSSANASRANASRANGSRANGNIAAQENQSVVTDCIQIPETVSFAIYICGDKFVDLSVSQIEPKLVSLLEKSSFKGSYEQLIESTWLQTLPAEWVMAPLEPFFDCVPIETDIINQLLEVKKFLQVTVRGPLSDTLDAVRFSNFVAAQCAVEYKSIVVEACSTRAFKYDDVILINLRNENRPKHTVGTLLRNSIFDESPTPSLMPFLNVMASSYGHDDIWMTGHGLQRLRLPEFEIPHVAEDLVSPLTFLLNGLAQAVVEKAISERNAGGTSINLDEPFQISSDQIIRGNLGALPFQECVPRSDAVKLKLVSRENHMRILPDYPSPEETDTALRRILKTLSLL